MEQTAKKKIVLQSLIFAITFVIAFFGAKYLFSRNKNTPNAMLLEASQEMNKSMPKMIDAETRLDSTSVTDETLNYHYTLIHVHNDSSKASFDQVKLEMASKAQINLDSNPAMQDYRENNIALHYIFKDKEKNEVFDYTVKPKPKPKPKTTN